MNEMETQSVQLYNEAFVFGECFCSHIVLKQDSMEALLSWMQLCSVPLRFFLLGKGCKINVYG